jgi:hypothetical protein
MTRVIYTPIGIDDTGREQEVLAYANQVSLPNHQLPLTLRRKLARLTDYVLQILVQIPEIEVSGETHRGKPRLSFYEVHPEAGWYMRVAYSVGTSPHVVDVTVSPYDIAEGVKRLLANILPMYDQLGWIDLRARLGAAVDEPMTTKRKVLISYRAGREDFAEAVAHRLGREGFLPWFDKWEIHAGDSLPREIGDGFQDVYAIMIILTPDYPKGRWAREELETAIVKRIEQDVRVIPILYEHCEIPELLRPLRYVNCTTHAHDHFEIQFREIIDALNEIELNPYRERGIDGTS